MVETLLGGHVFRKYDFVRGTPHKSRQETSSQLRFGNGCAPIAPSKLAHEVLATEVGLVMHASVIEAIFLL